MITQTLEVKNYETGEVVERTNTIIKKENKEEYVRLFLRSVEGIVGAKLTGSEHNVLYILQRYTINNSNLLLYNAGAREEIAGALGLKNETVKKAVEKLVKAGIVERPRRGMYYLNPIHFGRGDWKSIKKLRKEVIYEYDFEQLEMKQTHKSIATYVDENTIKDAIVDAEVVEETEKQLNSKTKEVTYVIQDKKKIAIEKLKELAQRHPIANTAALDAQTHEEIRAAGNENIS